MRGVVMHGPGDVRVEDRPDPRIERRHSGAVRAHSPRGRHLVATPEVPPADLIPGYLAASDVLGTGWFAAVAAEAGPGRTVAVVGDGAVGLLAVLAAKLDERRGLVAGGQPLLREVASPADRREPSARRPNR